MKDTVGSLLEAYSQIDVAPNLAFHEDCNSVIGHAKLMWNTTEEIDTMV